MSKIKELLKDKSSILVFDIDGVLAPIEWDTYNHFILNDEDWGNACIEGKVSYDETKVSKKMQSFLSDKDMSRIYVITRVSNNNELNIKKEFSEKYYNIFPQNVFGVKENNEKVSVLSKIKENYPDIDDYKIVMIEDTVSILTDIMEKTKFSTAHISSFLDI